MMFDTVVLPALIVIATITGAGMIVPQVVRLHRTRAAAGVSIVWAGVGLAINLWWTAYAAAEGLWGLVPVSVAGIVLYTAMAVLLVGIEGRSALTSIGRGHYVGLVPLAGLIGWGWQGAGLAIGLLYGAVFLPAVSSAVRSTDLSGISATTWLLAWIEAIIWLIYGITKLDPALIFGGGGGTLMATIILARLATARTPAATPSGGDVIAPGRELAGVQ